jgi:aspartate oxidase
MPVLTQWPDLNASHGALLRAVGRARSVELERGRTRAHDLGVVALGDAQDALSRFDLTGDEHTRAAALEDLRRENRDILWMGAGIVRDDDGLAAAERSLAKISAAVPLQPSSPEAAEVANLHLVGELIVRSAILRKESRGLHFSRSHPDPDPAFQRDTIIQPDQGKELST